jgi:DegV family protein with EDD domain
MRSVKIVSDSCCDLSEALADKYGISIVPFLVSFDGSTYYKENIEITNKEFYKVLRTENVYPKTSLPTIETYAEEFKKHTDAGHDVLCFNLTSKFSGSHQSAVNAAELVNDELGEVRVYVIDTIVATVAQGAVAIEAAKMRDAGLSAAEIYEKVNVLKESCILYITVDSLAYLQKGGRIGKASALAGSLLNIKPVIVLRNGELAPIAKVRGRKKALNELAGNVVKDVGGRLDDYEFFAVQADVPEEIGEYVLMCEREYGIKLSLPLAEVGVTIGAHVGPAAVGIGYVKRFSKM